MTTPESRRDGARAVSSLGRVWRAVHNIQDIAMREGWTVSAYSTAVLAALATEHRDERDDSAQRDEMLRICRSALLAVRDWQGEQHPSSNQHYRTPEGFKGSPFDYLRKLANDGLKASARVAWGIDPAEHRDERGGLASVGVFVTDNADYVQLTGLNKADDRLFDVRLSIGAAETLMHEIAGLLRKPLADAMQAEFLHPTVADTSRNRDDLGYPRGGGMSQNKFDREVRAASPSPDQADGWRAGAEAMREVAAKRAEQIGECANTSGRSPDVERFAEDIADSIRELTLPTPPATPAASEDR